MKFSSSPALGEAAELELLGVDYMHWRLPDGGDLYVTRHGRPFAAQLHPDSWFAAGWFEANREKLVGTSTVYRVRTRPAGGRPPLDLVVKWCRVGAQIPVDTFTFTQFVEAEFNSPYEEFALAMELRADRRPPRIIAHKPLGVYVPPHRLELWQLGRTLARMERKKALYREVELDIYRQYILIYQWIEGCSLTEHYGALPGGVEAHRDEMETIANDCRLALETKGFRMLDFKPEHIIVRPQRDGALLRRRDGSLVYALVDFELLQRTPEHERSVQAERRSRYLQHQSHRFEPPTGHPFPPHLRPSQVMGVDYVFGHSESTGGALWLVGRDPDLFDYFLTERWRRTHRERLSPNREVWHTRTKDEIHLVWKFSRVGEIPDVAPDDPAAEAIRRHGYNSPFEEFAIALALARRGVPTTYPRAIYMTGQPRVASAPADPGRHESHARWSDPNGEPVLRPDRNYIEVWGYWNGADETLAARPTPVCEPVSLLDARDRGWITPGECEEWLDRAQADLAAVGWQDLRRDPGHLLLSRTPDGKFWRDETGRPILRWCNFSLFRRTT